MAVTLPTQGANPPVTPQRRTGWQQRQGAGHSQANLAAHYTAGTAAGNDMSWMKTQGLYSPPAIAAGTPPAGQTLTNYTPPQGKGNSWLGVNPSQRLTGKLALEGLSGYAGRPLTPQEQQFAATRIGYTDQSGESEITGEQYNNLLQYGAEATGNTFTPWSTTAGTGPPPVQGTPPENGEPPPELDLPEYESPTAFQFNQGDFTNDAGYQFELAEGQRALQHAASAQGGVRGTNTMRDLIGYTQGLASTRFGDAYNRAGQTWDRNTGDRRYGHEAAVSNRQTEYAPNLLGWERNRDERRRDIEMNFDQAWQREQFGRNDSWKRHAYQNDDVWRRYQLEEERRWRLANGGNN